MEKVTAMIRSFIKTFVLVVGFAIPGSICIAGAILPVGQAEYDFIYDRQLHEEARSLDYIDYQLGPYRIDTGDIWLGPFRSLCDVTGDSVNVFAFAAEDFRSIRKLRATSFGKLQAGVSGRPADRLFVYAGFILDEELAKDEHYTGKKWRGFAGDVEQAFVHYHTNHLEATFGRFASFWGPRNSLVLAPAQKLDGFGYSFRWGRLTASYRLARLDGLDPDEDDVEQFENRYFAAHRFDFHLARNLTVGLFETVVFGGPGRQIDLFYLNPLIFFHGTQLNEGLNDNTTVGFDFTYKPKAGCKLYGQLLIDDIQLDNKSQGDQEPDQLGIIAGCYIADFGPGFDVNVEYSRVNNWTFNQMHERNRYLYHHKPIGGALGNDYDIIDLKVLKWFGDGLKGSVNLGYYRQGEGTIEDLFDSPWAQIEGDYTEPFPTGVVERTFSVALGFSGFLTGFAFVDVEAGFNRVENWHHLEGADETLPFFGAYLSTFCFKTIGIN